MQLDLGSLGLELGRQAPPVASVVGIPALLQMRCASGVSASSPLTQPCVLVEDGPAMPPLVGNLVRWRRQFVRQHEVTWDCGPGHGGGSLLLHQSWSANLIKVVVL
jgi:hypothetical protein